MAINYVNDNKGTMRKLNNISELFTYNNKGYPIAPFPWTGGEAIVKWRENVEYTPGNLVVHEGDLYVANDAVAGVTSDNNNAPGTETGETMWDDYVPPMDIEWRSGEDYNENQFVSYEGDLYVAKAELTNSTEAPITDIGVTQWDKYNPIDSDEMYDLEWEAGKTYDRSQFVSYRRSALCKSYRYWCF